MGCGCSASDRQINPVDTPPLTPEPGWLTSNGAKPRTNGNQSNNDNSETSASRMSCGVDTHSLNSMSKYNSYWNNKNLRQLQINIGTQCVPIDRFDVAVNTSTLTKHEYAYNIHSGIGSNDEALPSSWTSIDKKTSTSENQKTGSIACLPAADSENNEETSKNYINEFSVELLEDTHLISNLPNMLNHNDPNDNVADQAATKSNHSISEEIPLNVNGNDSSSHNLKHSISTYSVTIPLETNAKKCGISMNRTLPSSELSKCNVGIQTDICVSNRNVEEAPEFAPRPPATRKVQIMQCCNSIPIIQHIVQIPESASRTIRSLVLQLKSTASSDLEIVYEVKFADLRLSISDIIDMRFGVAKDFCNLFSEMCRIAEIREKQLTGFAKRPDYKIGHTFKPLHDGLHIWNTVFLNGSWRFVDCTLGAGYINNMGRFQPRYNEHYFLTDPDVFIWTHFPYKHGEENYSRWQLLETPFSLDKFNSSPKVTPAFFQYQVKIVKPFENPIVFNNTTEVVLSTPVTMRYKYKFHSADRIESTEYNQYVFCNLRENRLFGRFQITPPLDGSYILKVYAHLEDTMKADTILDCVIVFLLNCIKTWKNVPKYPVIDMPWGPTRFFAEFGMKMMNHSNPLIVVVSGRKTIMFETIQEMLFSQQLYDIHGNQIFQKGTLRRDDDSIDDNIVKFIIQPPNIAFYKLMIFACPKPDEKGQYHLPCVANFAIDCKQSRAVSEELRGQIFLKSKMGNSRKN